MCSVFPWYAVRVRSNFERTTASHLSGRGLDVFLPSYRSQRQWAERGKDVERPLFAGYLFCRFNANNRLPVLSTPGVVSVIGFGGLLAAVSDEEIEAVRTLVTSQLATEPWPFLREGEPVAIEHGPLRGVEGYVVQVKNRSRVVVSVALLQRSVAAEIDMRWVRPLQRPPLWCTISQSSPAA